MKTAISILLLLSSVSPSASAWQAHATPRPASRIADPLQEAEDLLQKQQYAQAEEKLLSLMTQTAQAKNPQAWFDLGFAQSHQEKAKDAAVSFQKAVALSPDWFEANLNLGIALAKSGDSAAAVTVFKHAVELKPTSGGKAALARAWIGLAEALDASNPKDASDPKSTQAAAAYDKAAELKSGDSDLLVRAGMALERAGDFVGAEQRFTKAAEAGSADGLSHLIALFASQHRDADAATWLNKYIAQNPRDAKARVEMAHLLAGQGKKDDAIAMLEAAKTIAPDPGLDRALASLYLDAKQYDKAVALLRDLAQKNPQDAQLRWDLGIAWLHLGKYPEAESEMLAALKGNSRLKDEADLWELAYAAQQNKHYELAIRVLDERAKRSPETATTYWIRAVSYDSLGAVKPAAANYRLFLDRDAGKSPDQDFKARHRLKAIEREK